MKIIRTLKVSPDEFFDHLEAGVLADAARAAEAGDGAAPGRVAAGLSYTKDAADPYRATEVVITAYERSRVYEARMAGMADTVTVRYEVEPDEKGLRVVNTQEMESFSARKRGLMRSFSEAVYLGRMAEALLNLEQRIIDAREGAGAGATAAAPAAPASVPGRRLLEKLVERSAGR